MRTLLATLAAVLVTGVGTSVAQEQALPTWSGFYAGVHGGYAGSNGSPQDTVYYLRGEEGTVANGWFDGDSRDKDGSISGGLQAGYNYQVDRFIFGIEADLSLARAKSQYSATTNYSTYVEPSYEYHLDEDLNTTTQLQWFGTVRRGSDI